MSPAVIILFLLFLFTLLAFIITVRKAKEFKQKNQHLQVLLNNVPELIWLKDKDSRFIFVNDRFSQTFSLSKKDIIGKTDYDLNEDQKLAQSYVEDDLKVQKIMKTFHVQEPIVALDGTTGWAETMKVPLMSNGKIIGTGGMARDITKYKKIEEKIAYLSSHDNLTGLPNRRGFTLQLNKLLNLNNCTVAVILFDLNNFKHINDSLGHESGDQTLIQIAERLKSLVNEDNIVARLSSDEFVIAHNYAKFENSLANLKIALLEQFEKPVVLNDIGYVPINCVCDNNRLFSLGFSLASKNLNQLK